MTFPHINYENLKPLISEREIDQYQPEVDRVCGMLEEGTGLGSDFLGWLHLPSSTGDEILSDLENTAREIQRSAQVFICIGIGGSYLGSKAAIDFVLPNFYNQQSNSRGPEIYFAGHNISSDYMADLLDLIADKDVCLNVISKSGTTTEPAIAFRLLKQMMEKKYGVEGARSRIYATTDRARGALKSLADREGYKTFVIPDDVGGRFSVLTPVGLLPMAVAGLDIRSLIDGAKTAEEHYSRSSSIRENPACLYAVLRHLLYGKGKSIEIMASFQPALGSLLEWWKQLAGESEGKNHGGIFPASVQYTTDLHSLGQWVQEGNRIVFETFLIVESSNREVKVPKFEDDLDGLNYLAGKPLDFVNEKAYQGTAQAHREGETPNMTLRIQDRSSHSLGRLFYFFERGVALTGYLMGINPFDQPGVEFYKKNMFALLNKPGYGKGN